MLKKELKENTKSFMIWLLILVSMFLVVYLMYPYIITDESIKELDAMMASFPEGMMKAFNMDMTSLTTAYGWFKTEGYTYLLLVIGLYSSMLGGSILLKEENDKTIEYLGSLPIKRSQIVTNKIIVGISLLFGLIIVFGLFNYIGLILSGDLNTKEFLLLNLTPLLVALPFFGINIFISTLMHNTKKTTGISIGMVFIFYIISVLSQLSENVEFLKYLTIYTLADTRNIITNIELNPVLIIISISLTILFIIVTYNIYNKKELV